MNGCLYAVGGDDGSSNLASVEVYSPEHDAWSPLEVSQPRAAAHQAQGAMATVWVIGFKSGESASRKSIVRLTKKLLVEKRL